MFGLVSGGWLLGLSALAATRRLAQGDSAADFLEAQIATAHFYAQQILPQAGALLGPVTAGAKATFAIDIDQMTG